MSERLSPSITADLSRCFIKLSATVHGGGWRRRTLVRKIRQIVIERKKRSFVSRGNARKIVFAFSHPLMMTLYKSPLFLFFNLTKLELDWKVGKSQSSNEKVNENWRVWRVLHKSFDLKRWLLERKGGRRGEEGRGREDCNLEAWWRLFLLNFRAVFYPWKPSVCSKVAIQPWGRGCIEKDPCLAQSFCEVEKGHSSIKSTTYNQMILYLKRVVILEEVRALFPRWDPSKSVSKLPL